MSRQARMRETRQVLSPTISIDLGLLVVAVVGDGDAVVVVVGCSVWEESSIIRVQELIPM